MKVALIPMSAKPYHRGHHHLLEEALKKCDVVSLYVSSTTRDVIDGNKMKSVWTKLLLQHLPAQVTVIFGGSPIRNVWECLGRADVEIGNLDLFFIFTGHNEQSFNDLQLKKYTPKLFRENKVNVCRVARNETDNISGSKMRSLFKSGDKLNFKSGLPDFLNNSEKDSYWQLLL